MNEKYGEGKIDWSLPWDFFMKVISIFKTLNEVTAELTMYFESHDYKNISVDFSRGVIRAERWRFLKKRFYVLKVKARNEQVTIIELNVTSGRNSTVDDWEEEKLQSKIYFLLWEEIWKTAFHLFNQQSQKCCTYVVPDEMS
jgi:hypothetical protein